MIRWFDFILSAYLTLMSGANVWHYGANHDRAWGLVFSILFVLMGRLTIQQTIRLIRKEAK